MAETRFAETINQIRELLQAGRASELRALLAQCRAAEMAEDLEAFSPEEQMALLGHMPTERAVDVFENLDEPHQQEMLDRLGRERQATFLREMEPDERADLFQALPEELRAKFLALLSRQDVQEVRELVQHRPTSAGGRMTTEFAWLSPEMTVAEAIEKFRQNYSDLEMVYYVYVLDEQKRLAGVLSLRQMLLHAPQEKIKDIMFRNVISVRPETDQEEVADILTLYDFYALPVVDESKRMLGIVTFDDIADVMTEEAGEDLERFGAVLPSDLSYARASIREHIRRRVPWLVVLLILSSISGFIILRAAQGYHSEKAFILYGLLVAFYPMLTGTAGNAGTQVATLMIRGMATGELSPSDRWHVLYKEVRVSLAMGLMLALLGLGRVMLTSNSEYWLFLGCIVGVALVAVLMIANLVGAFLPLLLKKVGLDPALMSGPLIATLLDILSAVVYFSLAALAATLVFPPH